MPQDDLARYDAIQRPMHLEYVQQQTNSSRKRFTENS